MVALNDREVGFDGDAGDERARFREQRALRSPASERE